MDSQEKALQEANEQNALIPTDEGVDTPKEDIRPAEEPVQAEEPVPVEETVSEEAPAEEAPAEETVAEETAAEEAPAEEAPVEEAPVEEAPAEETPVEEKPEEVPAGDVSAEDVAEETPAEETPAEETPVGDVADETPAEDAPAEETPVEDVAEGDTVVAETPVAVTYGSKEEIVKRVHEIASGEEIPAKNEIEQLKSLFYKLHIAEREAALKAYIDGGGNPETYQVRPDTLEEAFKAEMVVIREKRARQHMAQEAEKQANLQRKLEIIERIKAMATSPDEANKSYQEFKRLQQEWKEIRQVPADKAGELWRNYQLYVEQFYDLLKLNIEAREYDFRKNLEKKTLLCEAAEKLGTEADVVSAFHQLQKLHQEYRETGPVAKDIREEIWNRFKAASTVVNKRHQQHFETLRAREEENLARKTALCERAEAVAAEQNAGASDYERHTKEIIALQAEWKTIGFAPQKMNARIYERFRAACDDFFGRKAQYFRGLRETFAQNAEKKKALLEQAQALQDSTDWKSTGDKLIALQKEWKTIGMVPRKQGDKLWNDFLAACNKFFNARNAATSGTRGAERENLQKKRDIIARLNALADDGDADDMQEQVRQLCDEYNGVGHVPFKEKDKLYKDYRDALNRLYKEYGISVARRRDGGGSRQRGGFDRGFDDSDSERARLLRRYEAMKQEIQTYENNIGFLNASSKKGNSLIEDLNRKVQKLKDDMNEVYAKIKAIDAGAEADDMKETAE